MAYSQTRELTRAEAQNVLRICGNTHMSVAEVRSRFRIAKDPTADWDDPWEGGAY